MKFEDIKFVDFELNEMTNILRVLDSVAPDEVYNLAAQSFVHLSFEQPIYTSDCDYMGPSRILEAMRTLYMEDDVRFYQAGSSEMFGKVQEVPPKETTPFYPRSPYGVSKLAAHWIVKNYRETYGLFACSGILFNHESPRRGEYFVTQKIVRGIKDVVDGKIEFLEIGNPEAMRDWGHAKDYVRAMWLMLQQDKPDDYVVATGEEHSIRELANSVAKHHNMILEWREDGAYEVETGKPILKISSKFFRPCEVDKLLGCPSKIRAIGWKPEFSFNDLVTDMVEALNK